MCRREARTAALWSCSSSTTATSPGQATFFGSLAGSSIGLVAVLLGALFNARLNRRHDDRLRREEQLAVATALRAELVGCRRALLTNIQELEREDSTPGAF